MQKGWKVFSHLNGKSRKKLLACLLSISMIPVNGFTVMAATADQGNQAAVTQEGTTTQTVTSGISFAAESQNVTVGNFKYYEFQGTQAKDFDKVNFNISDQTALKIEQKTFKQADGTEVVKYMPIALIFIQCIYSHFIHIFHAYNNNKKTRTISFGRYVSIQSKTDCPSLLFIRVFI